MTDASRTGASSRRSTAVARPGPGHAGAGREWWQSRRFAVAMVLLALVPLLYPPIPPLVDLFGHMGRYRVMLEGSGSPLAQWYDFRWAVIGNLGVDLLIYPLGKLIGLEPAAKLIVMAIPAATVAGFLWVAHEVHGEIPPTAAFALPFAFGYPFNFGFVNFSLAMALCFLAFGLWLRLERLGRYRLRAALFVPISLLLWVAHTFGWGVFGLLAFSAEVVQRHDRERSWPRAVVMAAGQMLPLLPPLLLMAVWRSDAGSDAGSGTGGWFDLISKLVAVQAVLRDRWQVFDVVATGVALILFWSGVRRPELGFSRRLAGSLLVLALVFLLLPRVIFGSAYADMRLMPFVFAIAMLAIRPTASSSPSLRRSLAIAGVAFFLVRLGGHTVSYAIAADDQRAALRALAHVPRGARVASLVQRDCERWWSMPRNDHLGAMAMVRRDAFANDQWQVAGANLMTVTYSPAGEFAFDPSQQVGAGCANGWRSLDEALARLPFAAFDYLWLIDAPPPAPAALRGARLVWRGPGTLLYRLHPPPGPGKEPPVAPSPTVDRRPLLQ